MNLGVFDMIGLAASLVFALPLANYAVIQLFAGQTALGAGLLVVAIAMVVLPQYFLDPGRLLAGLAKGILPRQLRGSDPSTDDSTAVVDPKSVATDSESVAADSESVAADSESVAADSESVAADSDAEGDAADVTDAIDEAEPVER